MDCEIQRAEGWLGMAAGEGGNCVAGNSPVNAAESIIASLRYQGSVIALSENEERLVEAVRTPPPDAADHVITWVTRLRDLANGKNVDWSDTWTEEDLAGLQRASLSRFDEREREES